MNSSFMPHGYCVQWNPVLITLFSVANAGIFLAYMAIPIEFLLANIRQRVVLDPGAKRYLKIFAAFIFFCGTGHLIQVWLLWHPWYWFSTAWDYGTVFFSWKAVSLVIGRMDLYKGLLHQPVDFGHLLGELEAAQARIEHLEARLGGRD